MKYADVIVDLSLQKLDRVFQYSIPERLEDTVKPGMRVKVPFGNGGRTLGGYVVDLSDEPGFEVSRIKDIISIEDQSLQLEGQLIALASWMRRVYGSTMNQALKTVLPVHGAVRDKVERRVTLSVTREEARAQREIFEKKHQSARLRLMDALISEGELVFPAAGRKYNITSKTVKDLADMNLVRTEEGRVFRNPVVGGIEKMTPVELNPQQRYAVNDILGRRARGDLRPSLIHGITGSGKTEVYMELIADVLADGGEAIVLIPEIALTYQTVGRFYGRFKDSVSVLHSKLSKGERLDQMERAGNGQVKVMIGPRSALFTPFSNLKIIVIDEEHEGSYKSETVPRYHAREAAVERARLSGAFVVMGSATPSVDSYKKALEGEYRLYSLESRAAGGSLPNVEIADLRAELKSGNRSIFSRRLKELIEDRLGRGEQAMLFLNRRGYAGFVSCRACGYVVKCPHCDVSLTLHYGGYMLCHYCGYRMPEVKRCPVCASSYIGAFRSGTEAVTSLVEKEYPAARVIRMDRDTTGRKGGYDRILKSFADHEADIMVGTQMIVKGHDFPDVTLVGVLAADMSLNEGDYRSAEKTFQLLTQAAGRAGRGQKPGTAVIQTYNPEHYSVVCAANQDYESFYRREISYRRISGYPPASHMTAVCMTSGDEELLAECAERIRGWLDEIAAKLGGICVLGPADANPAKLRDIYRKAVYIKAESQDSLIFAKDQLEGRAMESGIYGSLGIQFDMDPVDPF